MEPDFLAESEAIWKSAQSLSYLPVFLAKFELFADMMYFQAGQT